MAQKAKKQDKEEPVSTRSDMFQEAPDATARRSSGNSVESEQDRDRAEGASYYLLIHLQGESTRALKT